MANVTDLPKIPQVALQAIVKGIENNHYVVNLEPLGVNNRTINLLEDGGIITLCDLMHSSKEKLLSLKNFGGKQLKYIFKALSNYHSLSDHEKRLTDYEKKFSD